jgi:hypothetical protein
MAGGGTNSSNPLGPQQGQSTPPTGGTGQMPSFANNPFGPPQQNTGGGMAKALPAVMAEPQVLNPSTYTNYGQGNGGGFGGQNQTVGTMGGFGGNLGTAGQQTQQPDNSMMSHLGNAQYRPADMESDMQYRPERQQPADMYSDTQYRPDGRGGSGIPFGHLFQRALGGGGQPPLPDQQPGRPAFMQSPEFQGYQTQMRGLQQQMDEYVRKAPMYQQLQDLHGKMQGYQQRHIGQLQQQQAMQQAMQRQMMERQSPFRQNPYQQRFGGGIQGLMGMLGGRGGMGMASPGSYEQYANANNQALARASQEVKRPTMSRADFDARNAQLMFPTQAARASEADFEALLNRNRNQVSSQVMSRLQQPMTMDMPQYQGRSFDLPTYLMKNGGKV